MAAKDVCGQTTGRSRHKGTWWWKKDVAAAVRKIRYLNKAWYKSKTNDDKVAYMEAKRAAHKAVFQHNLRQDKD